MKNKKRELDTEGVESNKKIKKPKVVSATIASVKEMSTAKPNQLKEINSSITQHFKDLIDVNIEKRSTAALQLLQQLNKTTNGEKREKELRYALKRLIRGCGASSNISRTGFFAGLVAFLKYFPSADIPIAWVFETMQKELHVGATITNKEDADAVVGKILTCGAILRSGRTQGIRNEHLVQITNILLEAARYRTYHSSMAYSFIIEFMESLPEQPFKACMWPLLQKEITKPWPKQTIQTVQCLIAGQKKFPNLFNAKFLKAHLNSSELLNPTSYQYLHKIFWDHSNINIITHPALEQFGVHIATSSNLSEFWTQVVDPGLEKTFKLLEIESLKIATDILNNLDVTKTDVVAILSPNFIKMFVEGLKKLKQSKDDIVKAFYNDFQEALVECCDKQKDDKQKVGVIRCLIQPPGIFNIEQYTKNRIVHQLINFLGEEGVKEMFEFYKDVFLGTGTKNPENSAERWMNFERMNAGYMLQHLLNHRSTKSAYEWREKQLKFLLTCALFHVDENFQICKRDSASAFSSFFSDQCRNMFFTSLQIKQNDLQQEKKILMNLVMFCNDRLQQKHGSKCIKENCFNDTTLQSWNSMMEALSSSESEKKKPKQKQIDKENTDPLEVTFQFLLMQMGLHLFREPETAVAAIKDLLKCIQRIKTQQKSKISNMNGEEDEPEWIEVIIDLFLHLLSQNSNALRNIVNTLFPHFCSSLSLSAVHQILAMLDMKDGQNPLSAKGKDEEEDDEEEWESDEEESEMESNSDSSSVCSSKDEKPTDANCKQATENDEDEDEDEDDDDEDDDDDDDEEEAVDDNDDSTMNDKLRNAVSQALMNTGAAATVDDDMESIDLNDLTEEEGKKLDDALANAFKAIKGASSNGVQSKKSKSYRTETTTLMHFRIRVLDLIEIYLQHNPTMMVAIEIMLALFDMLNYCFKPELQALQQKVERVVNKLTANKSYKADEDLNEEHFISFMRLIVEKRAPTLAFDITNRVRNKCLIFLIVSSYRVLPKDNTSRILVLWQEYVEDFINMRNPFLNSVLLSDIFKLRCSLVWKLAEHLVTNGISIQTRTFRRIQILETLSMLYKNNELQKMDIGETKEKLEIIESKLGEHIEALASGQIAKQSFREFQALLQLLMDVQKISQRLNRKSHLCSEKTRNTIQQIRQKVKLDSMQVYQRFCVAFKLQAIRNNEIDITGHQNGHENMPTHNDNDSIDSVVAENSNSKTKPSTPQEADMHAHGKKSSTINRKLKKLKKQQRMEAASVGVNGRFGNVHTDDSTENVESD